MNNKFIGNKKACEILGIHYKTLHNWDEKNQIQTIRTPGGKRLYNVNKFIKENGKNNVDNKKKYMLLQSKHIWSKR